MVPWCDILKGKTDCAIRSEEILSAGGRLGTTLLSHVLDWLSMLVCFHLISVANTFPFLLFSSLSIIEYVWTCSCSTKKHDFTFMETWFDNKLGIRQTLPQAENNTAHLSHTCFLDITWKLISLQQKQCLHAFVPNVVLHVKRVRKESRGGIRNAWIHQWILNWGGIQPDWNKSWINLNHLGAIKNAKNTLMLGELSRLSLVILFSNQNNY